MSVRSFNDPLMYEVALVGWLMVALWSSAALSASEQWHSMGMGPSLASTLSPTSCLDALEVTF